VNLLGRALDLSNRLIAVLDRDANPAPRRFVSNQARKGEAVKRLVQLQTILLDNAQHVLRIGAGSLKANKETGIPMMYMFHLSTCVLLQET
jgi:hypothetical protein